MSLFARPARTLQRWDTALRARPVIGLAAVDAHANIGWSEDEEPRRRTALALPSYGSLFRVLSQAAVLERAFSGDAAADAEGVWAALEAGRTFSITRAIATPAVLAFEATRDGTTWPMGSTIDATAAPPSLRASVPGVDNVRLVLVRDGQQIVSGQGTRDDACRAAGHLSRRSVLPGRAVPVDDVRRHPGRTRERRARSGRLAERPPVSRRSCSRSVPTPRGMSRTFRRRPRLFDRDGRTVRFAFRFGAGRAGRPVRRGDQRSLDRRRRRSRDVHRAERAGRCGWS